MNHRLADEPSDQAKLLAVHHLGLLPGLGEHPLQVQLLVTVGTGLFITHSAPAADTELEMRELVKTKQWSGSDSISPYGTRGHSLV